MADVATNPTPGAPPATPPAPQTPPPAPPPAPPSAPKEAPPAKPGEHSQAAPSLTMEQVEKLIADREAKWEAERLPKLRAEVAEAVTAPIRRDAKIKSLREELRAAGRYLPADDDASDPTSPGDLAALCDLDDVQIVAKDKAGNGLTRLDVELNRTRARLSKRTAKKTGGDALETPPLETSPDVFESIRKQTRESEAARAKAREHGENRVFNMAR